MNFGRSREGEWSLSPHTLEAAEKVATQVTEGSDVEIEDGNFVVSTDSEGSMGSVDVEGKTFYIKMNVKS